MTVTHISFFHRTLAIGLLSAILVCPSLAVRPDTGNNALTTAQAQEVAAKLGVPIMIIYMNYQTSEPLARGYYRTLLNAAGANRQFVLAEVDYQQMDDLAAKAKRQFPTWTFRTVPYYAFISPDGEFFAGGNSYDVDNGKFDRDRKDVLGKYPPFPLALQNRARAAFNQAGQLIDTQQYQHATMLIDKTLAGMWFPQALIARGKALREFCDAQARQFIKQAADAARDGNIADAMFAYDQFIEGFGATSEQGRDAARSLRDLQIQNAQIARDYQLARPQKLAAWYLAKAQALSDAGHLDAALTLCQSIRRTYARTDSVEPANTLAQSLIEKIRARDLEKKNAPAADEGDYQPLGM